MLIPGKRQKKRVEELLSWTEHMQWTFGLLLRDTTSSPENHLDHLKSMYRYLDSIRDYLDKIIADEEARQAREARKKSR